MCSGSGIAVAASIYRLHAGHRTLFAAVAMPSKGCAQRGASHGAGNGGGGQLAAPATTCAAAGLSVSVVEPDGRAGLRAVQEGLHADHAGVAQSPDVRDWMAS